MRGLQAQLVPKDFKGSKVPQAQSVLLEQLEQQASWAQWAQLAPKVLQAPLLPWPAQLVPLDPKAQLVLHLR